MTESTAIGQRTSSDWELRAASDFTCRNQELHSRSETDWGGVHYQALRYRRQEGSSVHAMIRGLLVSYAPDGDPCPKGPRVNGVRLPDQRVPRGNIHVFPPDTLFEADATPTATPITYLNIVYSPEVLAEFTAGEPIAAIAPRFVYQDRSIADLLLTFLGIMRDGDPGRLYRDAASRFLLASILRGLGSAVEPPASGGLAPWQRRRVTEYLQAHAFEEVSLADLAALVGLSTFHFARAFKRSVGVPPHAHQRQLRCARARQLLETSDMSVTEIAFEVGYESSQALARMFSREVGVSPGAYRRERRR